MSDDKQAGPVLFDLQQDSTGPALDPASAPPVPEDDAPGGIPDPAAMQRLATLAARPRNRLMRWFWGLLGAVISFFVGLSVYSAIGALLSATPILGLVATALIAAFALVCLLIALRELSAFARLARLDRTRQAATRAMAAGDLAGARKVVGDLSGLYANRPELRWGQDRVTARLTEVFDADAAIALAENALLAPLDQAARREVEVAARRVATVTALIPLALADVFAALATNLTMIRRVAEVYGGRSGTLETWRLTRAVLTHLAATGAVAVGDDLIGSVAGGHVLGKVSRRFGEGAVNAALTARVGIAAMEVCRPLPFNALPKPTVTRLLQRALAGFFGSAKTAQTDP
ncbi:MAG: YcjF family protein [Qingshengfaniella sp.]